MENFKGGFQKKMEEGGKLEYTFAIIALCMIVPLIIIYFMITKLITQPIIWLKKKIGK